MTAADVASVNEQPHVVATLQPMCPQTTDSSCDDLEVSVYPLTPCKQTTIYYTLALFPGFPHAYNLDMCGS